MHTFFTQLFITIFSFSLLLPAAMAEAIHQFHIEWDEPISITLNAGNELKLLAAEHITSRPETGLLPWFVAAIAEGNKQSFSHIVLQDLVYDTLAISLSEKLADADLIGNDFHILQYDESAMPLLSDGIHVFPLRIANGQVERLLSFTLLYESDETPHNRFEDPIPDYAEQSVLLAGDWYKIGVTETGVYKINYNDLQQMGINPQAIDPRKISLYGNGNGMLPESNSIGRHDDLVENAIYVQVEADGSFNEGDYILFYGLSPVKVRYNSLTSRFDHQMNYYTDTTYYFLTIDRDDSGLRIPVKAEELDSPTNEVDEYLDYQFYERDLVNLMATGREWFGEEFSTTNPQLDLSINFPNLLTDRAIYIQTHFIGRSVTEFMYYDIEVNGQEVINQTELRSVMANESLYARESSRFAQFYASDEQLNLQVNFYANNNDSRGWLNYIRLNAWCALQFRGGQFQFRNPMATGPGNISRFHVQNTGSAVNLWEVTNPLRPKIQQYTTAAEGLHFTVLTDSLREYILFDDSHFLQMASAKKIPNQNLHGINDAEYLIVTPPVFFEQAMELASFHESFQGLKTVVVDINEIYNEFASGSNDITALRDFVRMVYLRSNHNLKYLLMFGDASYDYKDRIHNNTNFVPTYQALESLRETASWVTDDYFGLLGHNEGLMMAGTLDIGIGRFPVTNTTEAALMVKKVKHYMKPGPAVTGDWRNNIGFMGDDQDNNLHFNQAESLSQIVDTARNLLNISKIYLDAYPRQAIPGGFRYPDANKAIIKLIESGALLVNYTGHGGVNGLTDERVITIGDVVALKNFDKMPLFITATCEFSRFDDPEFVSAGERLILNPNGGGIALMTTTRLAFAHSNFFLNRRIYSELFNSSRNEVERLGDALRKSKNPSNPNIYNFVLLGDPALRLASPSKRVITSRFNNQIIHRIDTISAMSVVQINGEIVDSEGLLLENFNGYIYPKVFDKQTTYRTLSNGGSSQPANFRYFDRVIHVGKATVSNGLFEFSFAVPRDIAYQYGKGRISYYALDTATYADASGVFSEIIIGGIDTDVSQDDTGPQIELYVNHPGFNNGDVVMNEVVIHARLFDPQGINHLGVGFGRDIMGYLNNNTATTYNLNDKFIVDVDSYTAGSIVFRLPKLENGEHRFRLKAWDLHNNSSEVEVFFVIDEKHNIQLSRLANRPNPFNDQTQFVFEHNKPGAQVDIQLEIFSIDGLRVAMLEANDLILSDFEFVLNWNGRDASGQLLPAGMYLYRFMLTDQDGYRIISTQKMVITR